MIVDGIIIGASILVYGDIDAGLFGVISLFCMTKVLDGILYGAERGSLVTVVSKKSRVIGQKIMDDLDRGVTYLKGEGGYSGGEQGYFNLRCPALSVCQTKSYCSRGRSESLCNCDRSRADSG